ncbi:alpha-L-fucosidase [Pinibacter aurantiacus]|uniref:Alpha-L-fucosidase n=1 Tax=Pinibacter aurantiacus TaxID=2851599 RepID=A0A9E2W4B0_9BACT|nr:alpha-L-fucosidase [Pinibacter aurantiacus]MBV4357258.1 alpha-L-fucosidase [Pinibacter aurantiacus]
MKKLLTIALFAALCPLLSKAQPNYTPTAENLANREEFQNDKFGIFIHWGIYSMLADGEWALQTKSLKQKNYEQLASGFYPSKFNADAWVAAIKASGAKYICITSRHHDGFSMFDTKYSDYNIVKATPFKRDILKELSEACAKQGIRLHVYYSHLDWGREDYPVGRTGRNTGRTGKSQNYDSYFKFMNNQLTEILTNYGKIGAIWFDGKWDQDQNKNFDWRLDEQYALIHSLQPACMIGNNHHEATIAGEDFQMFEKDLPGQNTTGFADEQKVGVLPMETCETMNNSWGYNINDNNFKSTKDIVQYLVKAAGNNANFLLNVGPQPNGEIPAVSIQRLKEVGDWMQTYGETVYGTRGGAVSPRAWGVTTQKGNKLFVHILKLQDNVLFVPLKDKKIKKATVFATKSPLKFTQNQDGVVITLDKVPDEMDYVVELAM